MAIFKNIYPGSTAGSELLKSLDILKNIITGKQTFLLKESRIIFTCGAEKGEDYLKTKRGILMKYAKKHIKSVNFFAAEKLFKSMKKLDSDGKTNLLLIEKELTKYSDCIIIILESPGAFTELGAFSYRDELAKKILVINDKKYKGQESFVNEGPIDKIDNISTFKSCIWADYNHFSDSIVKIENRIDKLTFHNKQSVDISTQKEFKNKDKLRLYLLHDLISILYPVTHAELLKVLEHIYEEDITKNFNFDLSLLTSLNMVYRYKINKNDSYYYCIKKAGFEDLFLKYTGFNYQSFRANYLMKARKVDSRLNKAANYYE